MAESRKVRIQILENRLMHLQTHISVQEISEAKRRWVVSEIKALEWAIPILKDFIAGKMRRILEDREETNG